MKLVTFTVPTLMGDMHRIGVLSGEEIYDLNLCYAAYLNAKGDTSRHYEIAAAIMPPDMIAFFHGGQLTKDAASQTVQFAQKTAANGGTVVGPKGEQAIYPIAEVTLKAPVPRPNSIRDTQSFEGHMKNFERRTGKPAPELWYHMPAYYKGNPSTVIGTGETVLFPNYTEKLDYELEFGIYIGKQGKDISVDEAPDYIAGYTIFNDISARDAIQKDVTLFLGPAKGKDMDTGNIMGPCLVTPDELDVFDLQMTARINGELWSQGSTSDMYWSFPQIIEYISKSETLYPGDFIGSGTICNGCGDELDKWLKPGDVMELEVEGIGVLKNRVQSLKA
jgi:2-keto-4-pentenoate hydratase/2-oxohepta-3-ene-1,7-dioic acid hydratase in catechol pathway